MRRVLLALTLIGVGTASAADDDWSVSLTPYLLLPGIEASLGYDAPAGDPDAEAGPSDILSTINFVVMLKTEVRHGRGFSFVDWMYIDLGNVDSVVRDVQFPDGTVPVGASVTVDSDAYFDGFIVMFGGGYGLVEDDAFDLDAYGGLRTLNLSAGLRWSLTTTITSPGGSQTFPLSGVVEDSSETWDVVLGARSSYKLGDDWTVFGLADYGWGHESSSWNAMLGVRWRWGDASIDGGWREIAWEGIGESSHGRLRLFGPIIGATFRF